MAPAIVVLFDSARSAEPPHNSGITAAIAFRTLPEAALVETSLPESKVGRAPTSSVGVSPFCSLSNKALAAGFAADHESNEDCHCEIADLDRSASDLVYSITSGETSKVFVGSKPRAFFRPASSS
ncbi:unannotated protein [freshwater metagenome]|uniref:Unannotated protein n=1 Tax=freshwater metagenome TaxID=449393 RepID=A0A6J6ISD9_9ZZZZ